jgi:hypothetical protein
MKKYYIYHIEGIKIGCSDNPKRRVNHQGYSEYTILETYDDIITASNREIELQKEYGYKVDTIPYWKTLKIATKESRLKGGKKGGEWSISSGHMKKLNSLGGKAIAKINRESGRWSELIKLGNIANSIPVEQRDINGNIINEFKSAREADRQTGVNQSSIIKCCKGKAKTAGGYIFNYKTNDAVFLFTRNTLK